jgi:predicted component of type VI protein secretion system
MPNLRLVRVGAEAPLEVRAPYTMVGRDPHADLVVDDGSVSRRHAVLEQRAGTWVITDQGSANGTWIDGSRVTEAELRDGQTLRLGAVSFAVLLAENVAAAPPEPPARVARTPSATPGAMTMSQEEAAALLGIGPDAAPEEIREQYRRIYNDLQIRLTNAPAASVRRMYQKNVQDLKMACEVLCPGLLQ